MSTRKTFLVLFAIACAVSLCSANGEVQVQRTEEGNTQEDRKRLAEAAIAEGRQFQSQGNAEAFRKALERYEKAFALLPPLNDRPGAAVSLGHIGTVHYLLGERQKALDAFQGPRLGENNDETTNRVINRARPVRRDVVADEFRFHSEGAATTKIQC